MKRVKMQRKEEKEKDGEKDKQVPVARDTMTVDKGKQIITDTIDLTQGPIDLSSLSPIQALKLATLAQAKVREDLLKYHSEDKELISMATNVLEKILPSFKQHLEDSPSGKLRCMLKTIDSHFVPLEKATDGKVLKQFNPMWLRKGLKMVEGNRVSLISSLKTIQEALDEGSKIYKSCLILPKFTIEIDKKIKECEGQLADISQFYVSQSIFASNYEAQVMALLDKIKSLNQENDRVDSRI